ncbi:SREC-like protein [Mya arenaria]|uniref:SREC-like protein n=1 Tax=Mya arenaria TaxID=6604 RepID=A0ABY7EXS1_MYAAR|nr:SREC-like protein [Mya arenaria]
MEGFILWGLTNYNIAKLLPFSALEKQCESKHSATGVCLGRCSPGYFGKFCGQNCSENCLDGICNKSSGICKDCTRTYLENCSIKCGQGCREKEGFPTYDRQSGKCLHGCYLYHYGDFCNNTCKHCKGNSSNTSCDINGVCQYGCENGYWGEKCSSKCSANCGGDAYGNRCNSTTGECFNGCIPGWIGRLCGETMEQYHYFGEQNSPGHYDEINSTISDCDIGNVPSNECTDDSNPYGASQNLKTKLVLTVLTKQDPSTAPHIIIVILIMPVIQAI